MEISVQTHFGCRNIGEFSRRARTRLLPVIRELAGFKSLSLIKIEDDTVAFILVFATRAQSDAASEKLRQLIPLELPGLAAHRPEVLNGAVLWETRW